MKFFNTSAVILGRYERLIAFGLAGVLLLVSCVVRYTNLDPSVEVRNIDATYHAALTGTALSQRSIKDSLLLPTVTLSDDTQRFIPWGSTIPDRDGYYYYVSFPMLSFAIPYLTIKSTGTSHVLEKILVVNFLIELVSAVLLYLACVEIVNILRGSKRMQLWIPTIIISTYLLAKEVFYSQGIIYWAQSLNQIFLLAILLLTIRIVKPGYTVRTGTLFLYGSIVFLSILTEWTSYLAALAVLAIFLIKGFRKKNILYFKKEALTVLFSVFIGTILFITTLLAKIPYDTIATAIQQRFVNRSTSTNISIMDFIHSYVDSFGPWIFTTLILLFIAWYRRDTRRHLFDNFKKTWYIFFFGLVIMTENVMVIQHAMQYDFDRLKLSILLSTLSVVALVSLASLKRFRIIATIFLIFSLSISIMQTNMEPRTISKLGKYDQSIELIQKLTKQYPNATYLHNGNVRGWMTLAVNKNVIENVADYTTLKLRCRTSVCVWLISRYDYGLNYEIEKAIIYDTQTEQVTTVKI